MAIAWKKGLSKFKGLTSHRGLSAFRGLAGDYTPGSADDVLLLSNGIDGLLLVDNTSFLKLTTSA